MSETQYQTVGDLYDGFRESVLSGTPPVLYPIGSGDLARIEVGPGSVIVIGGAPRAGKTAFVMQAVVDALRLSPDVKALVCNVEMTPARLLERQLARLGEIDLTLIRHRQLTADHGENLSVGFARIEEFADRLAFLSLPYDLAHLARSVDAFEADIVVIDYIQRLRPMNQRDDMRLAIAESMGYIRQFADLGVAVVVVSALGRSKDSKGRASYDEGLSLASFRESSELEYGADDAFILVPSEHPHEKEGVDYKPVTLRHLKCRNGEARDIDLRFIGKYQRFESATSLDAIEPTPTDPAMMAKLKAAWKHLKPSATDEEKKS